MSEPLILVDARNRAVGRADKWTVHAKGLRHRAFSIFLVDPDGRLLLQRRSGAKYHSAGLWANSCCGHPRPGERTLQAAQRRLGEELGASAALRLGFLASYRTELPNGLIENEVVRVYFGATPATLAPNPNEVSALAQMTLPELLSDSRLRPRRYAYWLRYYLINHCIAIRREVTAVVRGLRQGEGI